MEPTNNLKQAIKDYKSGNSQAFDILYLESKKYVYTCIYKVMSGMIMSMMPLRKSCRKRIWKSARV